MVTTRLGFAPLYRTPDTVKEAKPSACASAATESNIVLTAPVPIEAAPSPSAYIARLLIVRLLPLTDTSPSTPTVMSPNLKLLSTTEPSIKTLEAKSAAFRRPRIIAKHRVSTRTYNTMQLLLRIQPRPDSLIRAGMAGSETRKTGLALSSAQPDRSPRSWRRFRRGSRRERAR
jgi:hypothetical protein